MIHKLCITASIKDCFPKALVVFRGIEDSINIASRLGYDGIELALYHRDNIDVRQVKDFARCRNMEIPVISTGQIYTMLQLSFTNKDRDIRNSAVEIVNGIADVAAELGAAVNISRVRGSIPEDSSISDGLNMLTECLEKICRHGQKNGTVFLLEQMNRYETNYLNSAKQTAEYISTLGIKNLKLHTDTFHMNIEDADIEKTLIQYASELGYIHIADSNRLAPGLGHLNFKSILDALNTADYSGWLGIEVLDIPDPVTAARQAIDYIRRIGSDANV